MAGLGRVARSGSMAWSGSAGAASVRMSRPPRAAYPAAMSPLAAPTALSASTREATAAHNTNITAMAKAMIPPNVPAPEYATTATPAIAAAHPSPMAYRRA